MDTKAELLLRELCIAIACDDLFWVENAPAKLEIEKKVFEYGCEHYRDVPDFRF